MTITADTRWRGGLSVPYATWQTVILGATGPVALAGRDAWEAAGNLSGLCLAMLGQESGYGVSYSANDRGNLNPLNLRPRGGRPGFQRFGSLPECIREWRDRITSPTYAYKDADIIAELIAIYAPPSDANDTAGYVRDVVARLNAWGVETGAAMTKYQIVGLPGPGIELPVPLSHDIINLSQPNQRPGIKRHTPGYWVQHETANTAPSADAAMHNRWLHNGADGAQLSFHFVVDDHSIYQMIPIDEVTWQAADSGGPGNMSGISCELCVNAGADEAKARHNAEALAGGICKALGLGVDRVKRHYDFNAADPNRHHCPDHMMTVGYWPTFVANVGKIIAGGTAVEPFGITWQPGAVGVQTIGDAKALALLGEVTARRDVPLRQSADAKSPIVHRMKHGEKGRIVGTFKAANGRKWAFVEYQNGKVGRALASAFTPAFPSL